MGERTDQRARVAAILLIAVHALLLVWSAAKNSVTFDEAAHLPAGCAYLKYAEFRIYNYNPPLTRMIAAAPMMLFGHPHVPFATPFRDDAPQSRFWRYAFAFEKENHDRYQHLFFLGRLGLIPVSCLGAWLVFVWARSLYGAVPALAACAMWALDPDILAHGSIVGTDVATSVAMLLALWTWQRFCARPTATRALISGLAIGAAHCCKFTAILLWPAMIVMLAYTLLRDRGDGRLRLRDRLLGLAMTMIITFVTVNLCYGYQRSFEPFSQLEFQSHTMQVIQSKLGNLPAPLPRQLLLGVDALKWESEVKLPAYLMGESYTGGRWNYYPIALASKLPISILALLAMTIVSLFIRRPRFDETMLGLALVVLAVFTLFGTNIDLGIRYLLPLYPLAFILIARLWAPNDCSRLRADRHPERTREGSRMTNGFRNPEILREYAQDDKPGPVTRTMRFVAWLLIFGLVVESFSVCPRYFTFFNAFAGGPARGWKIVNDSNFDWGQGLIDLKKWQDDQHAGTIELAYWGIVDPEIYGIDYVPFGQGKDEKYVAISSYFLVGQRQRTSATHGEPWVIQVPYYKALQAMKPIANPSGTIFIFSREQIDAAKTP